MLDTLGLATNDSKCHWDPTTRLQHLGLIVQTSPTAKYLIPPDKLARLKTFAHDIKVAAIRNRRLTPARKLAAFTGLAQSLYLALPCARLFLRSIHDCVATRRTWDSNVRLSKQALRDLDWWTVLPERWIGRSLYTSPTTTEVFSDASGFAWGGTCGSQVAHGRFTATEAQHHITIKEMIAAHKTILSFLPALSGQHVLFNEDNQAVQYCLQNRTTKCKIMMKVLRRLYALLDLHSITLTVVYVKSADNPADAPSRHVDVHDWTVSDKLWDKLELLHGPHSWDRFASELSVRAPRFTGLHHSPNCTAPDAFAQDWSEQNNFANPGWMMPHKPYALLERLGQFLDERPNVAATVLAPYRPGMSFFATLRRVSQSLTVLQLPPGSLLPAHERAWVPSTSHLAVFRFESGRAVSSSRGNFVTSQATWSRLVSMADAT